MPPDPPPLLVRLVSIPGWWWRYRSTRPPTIVVLGMHRSGTSCVTHMVSRCGARVGPAANGKDAVNPQGYFESWTALQINRALLARSRGAWDAPPARLDVTPLLRLRMHAFVAELHQGDAVAVWKDPRTVLTYSAWAPALLRPVHLVVFRHPMSVARSLQRRNGFAIERSIALWCHYNERLLALTKATPAPTVWVDFDRSLDHLTRQVRTAIAHAGLPFLPEATDVYQPPLRRADAVTSPITSSRARAIYAALKMRLPG